jgi:hypothetical protein
VVAAQAAVEAAAVEVPALLSLGSIMLMAHQEPLSQSMPRTMAALDMMISR